jgi:glucosamine-6-phosphate deaminase
MIKVLKNSEEVGAQGAKILATQIINGSARVIALPTGTTPIEMYKKFVSLVETGLLNFNGVQFFNLDEYVGLSPDDPLSYAYYMNENLFSKIPPVAHDIPKTDSANPIEEARRYEEKIEKVGGFDLCFLGIGIDGHIGFNEPGSEFSSVTRVVELHPSTMERNSMQSGKKVPEKAITVGIKTIMKSRRIVLMATGKEKAEIVKDAFSGKITPNVPASVLQLHPDLTVLLDEEAAVHVQRHVVP